MATKRSRDAAPKKRCDAKCSLCAANQRKTNAESYCYNCENFLCTSCLGQHDANHKVVEVDAELITEKCREHDVKFTLYCEQDGKILCRMCHILNHRSCNNVQSINESLRTLSADIRIKNVHAKFKSALTNINKSIIALDKHMAVCQKKGSNYVKDLENKAKALMSRIEEDKKAIKDTQEELRLCAEKNKKECAEIKDELEIVINKMKKSKGCKVNMVVLKNKGLQITQRADTLCIESNSLINGCQLNVTTNKTIHEYLNSISSLAKPSKATISSINVRMPDDNCSINGCCVLGDGSLVIIDTRLKELKRIEPIKRRIIAQWNTKGRPLDVCCTGDNKFAVSFSSVILEYNEDRTEIQTIKLGHAIQKMTYQGDLLYVSNKKTLYVYNFQTRDLMRKIQKDADGRNLFFPSIQGIALNLGGDRVYVADENGLVCVNKEGQLIFRLTQDALKLKGAEGVVTDHRGHVFVSGWGSSNVVEVTEQGNVVGELLSRDDGIERPYCIGFNVIHRQLYVGGGSDTLLAVSL